MSRFKRKGSRASGTNPRALGTNPKALGTNPRALGTNPRAFSRSLFVVLDHRFPSLAPTKSFVEFAKAASKKRRMTEHFFVRFIEKLATKPPGYAEGLRFKIGLAQEARADRRAADEKRKAEKPLDWPIL
jgi:hypothetical protein